MNSKDLKILNSVISDIPHIKDRISCEASPSLKEELLSKLQKFYGTVIFLDPVFALECNYEVEVWNEVFKNPIGNYQLALRQGANNVRGGRPLSEIQSRLALILDRATGFYLSLAQKLLHRIPDGTWPRSVLCQFHKLKSTSTGASRRWGPGRFDLDDVTLEIQLSRSIVATGSSQSRSRLAAATKEYINRPKILSRGAQLPGAGAASSLFDPPQPVSSTDSVTRSFPEAVTYLVQHCLIHLGDIARYQHHYTSALSYYTWAWVADPSSGHSYNQMAIMESTKAKKQLDSLCYFYVRAMACQHLFPAAWVNLGHIMVMVLDATRGAFAGLFETSTCLDQFWENFLQTPTPLLLRFHAFARISKDHVAIVAAAKQFTTAVKCFTSVVGSGESGEIPLRDRVCRVGAAFRLLKPSELLPRESVRRLQLRLLKVAVVHAYGLETNWSCGGDRILRHTLLYTTVSLVDWMSSICMAVHAKFPTVSHDLPIIPILVLALALNRLCELPNQRISDADWIVAAPAFGQSTTNLLNYLSQSCDVSEDVLQDAQQNLPELYALQGFATLGLPLIREPPPTRSFNDLVPTTFLRNDDDISLSAHFVMRTSLLVKAFQSLAIITPCLLKWCDERNGFLVVERSCPGLPEFPPASEPPLTVCVTSSTPCAINRATATEAEQGECSDSNIKTTDAFAVSTKSGERDTQATQLSTESIIISPLVTQNSSGTQEIDSETVEFETSLKKLCSEVEKQSNNIISGVERELKEQHGVTTTTKLMTATVVTDNQNNSVNQELARFIKEQALQVVARQNKMLSEAAVDAELPSTPGNSNHSYAISRPQYQKEMPLRFTKHHQHISTSQHALTESVRNYQGRYPPLFFVPPPQNAPRYMPSPCVFAPTMFSPIFAPMRSPHPPPLFQGDQPPKWGPPEGGWLTDGMVPQEIYQTTLWRENCNNNNNRSSSTVSDQYSLRLNDEGSESPSKPSFT